MSLPVVPCCASFVAGALIACWWWSGSHAEPSGARLAQAGAVAAAPSQTTRCAAVSTPTLVAATAPDRGRAGRVSLDAHDIPLNDALAMLARQTGVRFEIAPGLAAVRISRRLVDVEPHTALTTLLDGMDWLELFESPAGSPARLSAVNVYPRGGTQEALADMAESAARRKTMHSRWNTARTELQALSVAIADMEFEHSLEAPDLDLADAAAPLEGPW